MPLNKNSIFETSDSPLDGTTGIIYILFVGRDNYANNIQSLMTDVLFADRSNVNQVMHRLVQKGNQFFISKGAHRLKGQPGRARDVYTANLEPIMGTLKRFSVKFDEGKLTDALGDLSKVSDFFPKFLTNMYQIHIIRRFQWHQILSMYFLFLSVALRSIDIVAYPMPTNFKVSQEKVGKLLEKYPSLCKELGNLFSQLNSPTLIFNPKYIEHLNSLSDQLYSAESNAMTGFKFLKGLQDMGVTDISVLLEQVRTVMDIDKTVKQIQSKLLEIEKIQNNQESKRES